MGGQLSTANNQDREINIDNIVNETNNELGELDLFEQIGFNAAGDNVNTVQKIYITSLELGDLFEKAYGVSMKNLDKHIKLNNGIDITVSPIKNKSVFYISYTILHGYLHELEGVKPVVSSSRYYPYGENVVHVVGYVGEASLKDIDRMEEIKENLVPGLKVGKSGIEYSNEKILIGKYGIKRYEVNSSGKRISQLEHIKESQGEEIKTTIDLEIQQFAQELLKDRAGSICAMDIFTGEVKRNIWPGS